MRAVFFGNHTVGVTALDALRECADVAMVVAHPTDPEDGVRYHSVHDHAARCGLKVMRSRGDDPEMDRCVRAARPDLILSADYRYLLPMPVVDAAKTAAVNLHPSLLPRYRGRAAINWAILRGERELGLTAHLIAAGMDAGDIVEQARFTLDDHEDVGDALAKLYPLYAELTRRVVGHVCAGHLPRRPQNHALATAFPHRRPEDGAIDWTQPAEQVHRLVRAVAAPYPGAFGFVGENQIQIWRAQIVEPVGTPGTVLTVEDDAFVVACGRGSLRVTRWDTADGSPCPLEAGAAFQLAQETAHHV